MAGSFSEDDYEIDFQDFIPSTANRRRYGVESFSTLDFFELCVPRATKTFHGDSDRDERQSARLRDESIPLGDVYLFIPR